MVLMGVGCRGLSYCCCCLWCGSGILMLVSVFGWASIFFWPLLAAYCE